MLGILLLYIIGKTYFELAKSYEKNQWGFGLLGIGAYYLGTFITGMGLGLFYELNEENSFEQVDETVLTYLALPGGILTCVLLYYYLKRLWTREVLEGTEDILDEELF